MAELSQLIEEAGKAKPSVKRLEELSAALCDKFGGAVGLAEKFESVFAHAPPAIQARVLDNITKILSASIRLHGAEDDVSNLSDEELKELENSG